MPSVSKHLVSLFQDAWMTHPLSNIVAGGSTGRLAFFFVLGGVGVGGVGGGA